MIFKHLSTHFTHCCIGRNTRAVRSGLGSRLSVAFGLCTATGFKKAHPERSNNLKITRSHARDQSLPNSTIPGVHHHHGCEETPSTAFHRLSRSRIRQIHNLFLLKYIYHQCFRYSTKIMLDHQQQRGRLRTDQRSGDFTCQHIHRNSNTMRRHLIPTARVQTGTIHTCDFLP